MKVFISWSGETSKNIADIFRQWIPSVIQSVKPYYSPDDITKGTRWSSEIAKELDESKVGIICLTAENLESPWIMFEAGALSKNIDKSKVCPILFGVDPSDIKGPLVQFQAAKFTKDEIKKVVRMINSELESNSLSSEVFENVFEMWWPKLSEKIEVELGKAKKTNGKETRSERDILEEILSLSRNLSIRRDREHDIESETSVHPGAIDDTTTSFITLVNSIFENEILNIDIIENLQMLLSPIRYMNERIERPRIGRRNSFSRIEEAEIKLDELKVRFSTRNKRVLRSRSTEDKISEN
jgi:hypothetical protein